jgi:predicted DNA-binding transcriptional regulator AlpA
MPGERRPLPVGMTPRGLTRVEAADYCGLAPSTFDARVGDGSLPKPMFPGRCRIWDRLALDRAMNSLSGIAEESSNAAEEAALGAMILCAFPRPAGPKKPRG